MLQNAGITFASDMEPDRLKLAQIALLYLRRLSTIDRRISSLQV
jgi:hypothetical protein